MYMIIISLQSAPRITVNAYWDFPGDPGLRVLISSASTARGSVSIPGEGTKIPHATQCSKNKTKSEFPSLKKIVNAR